MGGKDEVRWRQRWEYEFELGLGCCVLLCEEAPSVCGLRDRGESRPGGAWRQLHTVPPVTTFPASGLCPRLPNIASMNSTALPESSWDPAARGRRGRPHRPGHRRGGYISGRHPMVSERESHPHKTVHLRCHSASTTVPHPDRVPCLSARPPALAPMRYLIYKILVAEHWNTHIMTISKMLSQD